MTAKSSGILVMVTVLLLTALLGFDVVPWLSTRTELGLSVLMLCVLSAGIWMLTLWWALHHLVFQIAGFYWRVTPQESPPGTLEPRIAVFYATCDDFDAGCFQSCVAQDYPANKFQVVVCDDSSESSGYRELVDQVCKGGGGIWVVRRDDRSGYKAGNLNHAFDVVAAGERFDWIAIVDADQHLPADYLRQIARVVEGLSDDIAFIQGARDPYPVEGISGHEKIEPKTPFEEALEGEVRIFFERDLACRSQAGFLPFLGHGGAIRTKAWIATGGIPRAVSEDYAFAMKLPQQGLRGARSEAVRSWDGFPRDFGAFAVRMLRYASGAAELLTDHWWAHWRGPASRTERLDLVMLLATYALIPLTLVNLFLSAYLGHYLFERNLALLTPMLPYLFLGMFVTTLATLVSVTDSVGHAVTHWFWSFAVYGALLPAAGWRFIQHLFRRPAFERTPKRAGESPRHCLTAAVTFGVGLLAVLAAWKFSSPFSPIVAATGLACMLFPLLLVIHEKGSVRAAVARLLVWTPGGLFLAGVLKVWLQAS